MVEPDLFTIKSHVLERYHGSGGEVVVPEGVCAIGREAFYDCATLTRITLPGSLRRIGKLAFAGCSGLTSVELPEGLERIDGSAFVFCTALTNVALPGSLWRMEDNVFRGCAALDAIEVSPQNRYYYSFDGVLFDGSHALICFPPAKGPAFSIPPGITEIGPYTFYDNGRDPFHVM